jgi:hypothetical protein
MITATGAVGLSGYEFMSAIRDGKLPPPPIASLVMRLDAVS